MKTWIEGWPVYRQLTGQDKLGLGAATKSGQTSRRQARTETAEKVVKSVCPYCAVGCGQKVYVQGGQVTQIEGDPDSPVSRGRLCPKGSASLQLTTGDARQYQVLYRKPYGTDWEPLGLDQAMDMIADRVHRRPQEGLAGRGRRPAHPADARLRQPGRGDPGQRRELPDQEAVHRAGCRTDREPGPYLTLRHRPRSGD